MRSVTEYQSRAAEFDELPERATQLGSSAATQMLPSVIAS